MRHGCKIRDPIQVEVTRAWVIGVTNGCLKPNSARLHPRLQARAAGDQFVATEFTLGYRHWCKDRDQIRLERCLSGV